MILVDLYDPKQARAVVKAAIMLGVKIELPKDITDEEIIKFATWLVIEIEKNEKGIN